MVLIALWEIQVLLTAQYAHYSAFWHLYPFSPSGPRPYKYPPTLTKSNPNVLAVEPGKVDHWVDISLTLGTQLSIAGTQMTINSWGDPELMVTPLLNLYLYPLFIMSWLGGLRPMQNTSGDSTSAWYSTLHGSLCDCLGVGLRYCLLESHWVLDECYQHTISLVLCHALHYLHHWFIGFLVQSSASAQVGLPGFRVPVECAALGTRSWCFDTFIHSINLNVFKFKRWSRVHLILFLW